jgi:hypothetical protein
VTSSVAAVKARLVAICDGAVDKSASLPGVLVIYGPITGVTTAPPRVVSVGAARGTREADSMTLDTAAERYTVDIVCSASILAEVAQADADNFALADYVACESAVGADPTLGLGGLIHAETFGDWELSELADSNGREANLRWSVQIYSQNT